MSELKRLSRNFFNRPTKEVAKELIGKYIVRKTKKGTIVGKIIEVEAYIGPSDKACHSYNYKRTERTQVMYMKPGTLYVYFIYGMYYCLNIVTEPEGIPCAVLIRKLYPIEGIEIMKENRGIKVGKNYQNLVDGPSKLCIALNITKKKFNGLDACSPRSILFFNNGELVNPRNIILGKRIGIDYAQEDKDKLLRYTLKEELR
ncbi:MAG: DNA-3-methyladenine glycosylase [Candidatus Heimdallarchaeota archaeon]